MFFLKLQAQAKHTLTIGYSLYSELKSTKKLQFFDENSGKYGTGHFISFGYNRRLGKILHFKIHSSYGYFRRQNFKLNDSTYGNAYSHMVPIKLEGVLNLVNLKDYGFAIFGGAGTNRVQYNTEANSNNPSIQKVNFYPLYVYGMAIRIQQLGFFALNGNYIIIKFTHFDNKNFLSFDLDFPIYRFNKEKKKK
ncbi:MAG: hypothetical protein ACOVP1_07695 [Bacteroidia bacterium]